MPQTGTSFYFLINERSGGQAGVSLARHLRSLVGDARVLDIVHTDHHALIHQAQNDGSGIIACGGDGTITWLMESVFHYTLTSDAEKVPVAVLPLGTGNDMALFLGWSPLAADHQLPERIHQYTHAKQQDIDRFVLHGPDGIHRPFYNYCSWGLDARIVRHFESLRQRKPWLFRSRWSNKLLYAYLGLQDPGRPLAIAYGEHVNHLTVVPRNMRSLALVNIPSYAGGSQLAPGISSSDGLLDVFNLGGAIPMALATQGVRTSQRLGRWRQQFVWLAHRTPCQCDGEGFIAEPGLYTVTWTGTVSALCANSLRD